MRCDDSRAERVASRRYMTARREPPLSGTEPSRGIDFFRTVALCAPTSRTRQPPAKPPYLRRSGNGSLHPAVRYAGKRQVPIVAPEAAGPRLARSNAAHPHIDRDAIIKERLDGWPLSEEYGVSIVRKVTPYATRYWAQNCSISAACGSIRSHLVRRASLHLRCALAQSTLPWLRRGID